MDFLDRIVTQAKNSPRLRQYSNIHLDYVDPCQHLFNAISPDSSIQPHYHGIETIFAIRGLMALVLFNCDAVVRRVQRFGIDLGPGNRNTAVGVEIPSEK